MDIEARQLALRNFEAVKRAETESARLFTEAKRATERTPGSRAAVLAQQAYTNRLNAQVGRFRASFALLAAEQGEQAESALALARTVKAAEQQRTLQLTASHAERRRNVMLQAANEVGSALKNLPGLPVSQRPPSAQQATVGMTNAFRAPEFLARFTHFFPSDIKAAAGSIQGNGLEGLDAVADCEACLKRDLKQLTENCCSMPVRAGGDPMVGQLFQRGISMAMSGLGSEAVAVGAGNMMPPHTKTSMGLMLAGAGIVGAIAMHLYMKD